MRRSALGLSGGSTRREGHAGYVRGQKLGTAEMLPLRIDAGDEVRLVFGIPYPLGVVGHEQGVLAKGREPAVQANGKVLQMGTRGRQVRRGGGGVGPGRSAGWHKRRLR